MLLPEMRGSDQNSELLFSQVSHSWQQTSSLSYSTEGVFVKQCQPQLMIVIDQTGNQRGRGVKDCLFRLRSSVSILSYYLFFNIEYADQRGFCSDAKWSTPTNFGSHRTPAL